MNEADSATELRDFSAQLPLFFAYQHLLLTRNMQKTIDD
jgi:hypothetical protein